MFELCEQKCSLPLERDRVIRLMMSFNEPLVATPRHPVQQTHAYICTFKEDKGLSVYVYLYLITDKIGFFYRYADEAPASEGCRAAEGEAVLFAEDMGFMIDDLKFDELDASQQDKLLATIPMFIPITPDIQEERPAGTVEVVLDDPIETAEVVEETGVEEQPEEQKGLEQKSEEPTWEPERFLSKFRMRATAERLKKNKA